MGARGLLEGKGGRREIYLQLTQSSKQPTDIWGHYYTVALLELLLLGAGPEFVVFHNGKMSPTPTPPPTHTKKEKRVSHSKEKK